MAKRNTFKYVCEDCGQEQWMSLREFDRRSKPQCVGCGSYWLKPTKGSNARQRRMAATAANTELRGRMEEKMNIVRHHAE